MEHICNFLSKTIKQHSLVMHVGHLFLRRSHLLLEGSLFASRPTAAPLQHGLGVLRLLKLQLSLMLLPKRSQLVRVMCGLLRAPGLHRRHSFSFTGQLRILHSRLVSSRRQLGQQRVDLLFVCGRVSVRQQPLLLEIHDLVDDKR